MAVSTGLCGCLSDRKHQPPHREEVHMSLKRSIAFTLALGAASLTHAASVANLSCSGAQGAVSMNVSYFGIGATLSQPAANGAAAQNTLMPLNIHAALVSFQTLFQAVAGGVPYSSCVLTTQGQNGGGIQFTFTSVFVSTMTAVATSASASTQRTSYVDATLLYSSVAVTQGGNTVDDGGTSTPPQWDVTKNGAA
jgi:hypothetical protein